MPRNEYATLNVSVHRTIETPEADELQELVEEWGMHTAMQESFWVVTYDSARNLRRVTEVARGGYRDVMVSVPTVLTAVLASGTDRFVVVHNHPSGNAKPTDMDMKLTHKIMDGANAAGLYFEDHVIIAPPHEFYSMTANGMIVPSEIKAPKAAARVKPSNMKMVLTCAELS